jgi:heptosyltransferase-1
VADRVGFDRDNLQDVVNLLFTTRQVPGRRVDQHVTDQILRVVSVPFGRTFRDLRLATDIWTSTDDDALAEALMATLSDGFVFLFQLGSTWQTRLWHEAGWIELGKKLLESFGDAAILLAWGTNEERISAHSLAALIGPGARVMDRYPLKTLAAILKRVDLVVGPDAGPVHMAAAVGTPTVSFYRSTDGRRNGPRGDRHIIVQAAIECSRCSRKTCNRDLSCREKITVDALFRSIQRLMVPTALPAKAIE